jgi:hypothetical protein
VPLFCLIFHGAILLGRWPDLDGSNLKGSKTDIKNYRNAHAISLLGQKLTNRRGPKLSFVRFCPKADKRGRGWIVRFVPATDTGSAVLPGCVFRGLPLSAIIGGVTAFV